MLPEDQEGRLRCYREALQNWKFRGYVQFKPLTSEWLANELPGLSLLEVARELFRHVEDGGEIDEQKEQRPEYKHHEFHYDLRVKISGRQVYFETVLKVPKNHDPMIQVVSVHDV